MSRVKKIEDFLNKEKCARCKTKMAVWIYMPGNGNYYCNDCVSRGCSCNYHYNKPDTDGHRDIPKGIEGKDWKWVEQEATKEEKAIVKADGLFVYIDEEGREYPCCEYDYDEDGFDKDKEELDENEEWWNDDKNEN